MKRCVLPFVRVVCHFPLDNLSELNLWLILCSLLSIQCKVPLALNKLHYLLEYLDAVLIYRMPILLLYESALKSWFLTQSIPLFCITLRMIYNFKQLIQQILFRQTICTFFCYLGVKWYLGQSSASEFELPDLANFCVVYLNPQPAPLTLLKTLYPSSLPRSEMLIKCMVFNECLSLVGLPKIPKYNSQISEREQQNCILLSSSGGSFSAFDSCFLNDT